MSTAVAKEIYKNISGLRGYGPVKAFAEEVLAGTAYKNIAKTRYVNDKQITDHYAIIPTGQGLNNLRALTSNAANVYETITRRFLAIFYDAAVYQKLGIDVKVKTEHLFSNFKVLVEEGYLKVMNYSFSKKKENEEDGNIAKDAEKAKKAFAGCELEGRKLGVIGLGAIGVLVANAATYLGMDVYLSLIHI